MEADPGMLFYFQLHICPNTYQTLQSYTLFFSFLNRPSSTPPDWVQWCFLELQCIYQGTFQYQILIFSLEFNLSTLRKRIWFYLCISSVYSTQNNYLWVDGWIHRSKRKEREGVIDFRYSERSGKVRSIKR